MTAAEKLVCVRCGADWAHGLNNCLECGAFCAWGPAKSADPSSFRRNEEGDLVPRSPTEADFHPEAAWPEVACPGCGFVHFDHSDPDWARDNQTDPSESWSCPLCSREVRAAEAIRP